MNGGRTRPDPVVQLSMTDKDVVERAKDLIDPGRTVKLYDRSGQKGYKEYHKPLYTIAVRSYKAARLMGAVLPFMGERRSQKIKELLEAWNSRPARTREHRLPPTCHPERKHYAGGLCMPCYRKNARIRAKQKIYNVGQPNQFI